MSEQDTFDKNAVNNRFMWDDDPFPVWTAGVDGLIWPEPEEGLLRFGLTELDSILGGIRGGSLIMVGGKMGCGKTIFAESLVCNLCRRQKATGIFFAPGKRDGFTLAGLAANHARLSFDTVLAKGDGTEAVTDRLRVAIEDVSSMRLVLDDRSGISLREVQERVRIAKLQYEVGFVVIDKWQNYANPFRFDDTGVCFLKEMARRFDIPVILFARMSKDSNKRLAAADVDDCGFLDHPDAVILMHNDERNEAGELELEVVKNKYGELGIVKTAYIRSQHRIENLAMAMK